MQQMSLAAVKGESGEMQGQVQALCPQVIAQLHQQKREDLEERMRVIELRLAAIRSKRLRIRQRRESLDVDNAHADEADYFWESWVEESPGFAERVRKSGINSTEDARILLSLICRQSAELNAQGFFPLGATDPRSWAYYVKKARLDCVYLELCRALLAALKTCMSASHKRREVQQALERSREKEKKYDLDEQAARLRVEELTAKVMSLRPGRT
ncbi:MAG TPA: hypothetical protein PKA31_00385 [Candidatus Moranbacteria bacterium]|nr:hypothetical protein [Candidatus Moranbacteria bacterium]